ncbi:lysozyme M1 [Arthrobacter sp. zg-Y20]|uniref:GH25 family lysozyme n=1 Tax=unclassified Arthrobacter TaxID=235627 RepID=UPI001D142D66|nr:MULTISPECIES: GH25 family lysozyme [unclassified Arthrobacter]MCC3276855.1 lysozyme M1 [Arthrobacter sp. zg-Y20]MDK1317016.1 GH25 family lysozyme [Arthrobacter sp. zg.Y20]
MKNRYVFRMAGAALALALSFSVVQPAAGWAQNQAGEQAVEAVPGNTPAAQTTEPADPAVREGETVPSAPPESAADGPAQAPADAAQTPGSTPSPSSAPTAPADGAPAEDTDLLDEVGPLGARMGQGLERLLTTGDPQVPTPEETALREAADAGALPAPEAVTPNPIAGPAAAVDPAASRSAKAPGTLRIEAAFTASDTAGVSPAADWRPQGLQGLDVSSHQENVDWAAAWNQGARFAYVKATEGTSYTNPYFGQQYNGSANVGMYRGAYHFALPNLQESGAAQANYFLDHGGNWASNTGTLPPLLDIEYNPYASMGNTCYNLSAGQMVSWIASFSDAVYARTGTFPLIYTTTDWWRTCTGNSAQFANHRLHIANYNTVGAGTLPNGWSTYAIWQYSSAGPYVGDSNVWNGNEASLEAATRYEVPSSYENVRRASGVGIPLSRLVCGLQAGGCLQDFQSGSIYSTPSTGTHAVSGSIRSAWWATGGQGGAYGYPISEQVCGLKDGGCLQDFQHGTFYATPSNGTHGVSGSIRSVWWAAGGQGGPQGYPISDLVCGLKDGGCLQDFQNGTFYASAVTAARPVTGAIRAAWWAAGGQNSSYGYPISDQVCGLKDGGCLQDFQNGTYYITPANGTRAVTGTIRKSWWAAGGQGGPQGYPVSDQVCGLKDGGCLQDFQNGTYYITPANGTRAVTGTIRKSWWAAGGQGGPQGYPVSDQVCGLKDGGCLQDFQNGTYYITPANGTRAVSGTIRSAWWAAGGQGGPQGYPISDQVCGLKDGGCLQDFQNGTYYITPANGTRAVSGTIRSAWWAAGGQGGPQGYPISDQVCGLKDGGCLQDFQNGTYYITPANGTRAVTGAIRSAWWAAGGQGGVYGYPVSDQVCASDRICVQDFEKGTIKK